MARSGSNFSGGPWPSPGTRRPLRSAVAFGSPPWPSCRRLGYEASGPTLGARSGLRSNVEYTGLTWDPY